jgi:endonuclease/exonuclease/phosphatase family metal-dependent hydrolase
MVVGGSQVHNTATALYLISIISLFPSLAFARSDSAASEPPAEVVVRDFLANHERELTVLTYNVRGLPWPIAKDRATALRAIGRALGDMRRQGRAPDVVLIQEGFGDISALVRLSGYRYHASGPQRGDRPPTGKGARVGARWILAGEGWGKFAGGGLHVLSDLPLSDVKRVAYAHCAGFDCLANKGAMLVRIDLPGLSAPLEIVNTHMNSRRAANVPASRSNRMHNGQTDELLTFVASHRTGGAPMIVAGDFNVKNAPDRYDYKADQRPFQVVSEYCRSLVGVCGAATGPAHPRPWLLRQDLQGFHVDGPVTIRPLEAAELFAGGDTGEVLSDHSGVLVRYSLSWTAPAANGMTVADLR